MFCELYLLAKTFFQIKSFSGQSGVSIKVHRIAIQMVLMIWIMYGIVFTTTFQTRLISVISSPRYAKQVSTLVDLNTQTYLEVHLQGLYHRIHGGNQKKSRKGLLKMLKYNLTLDVLQKQVQDRNFISQLSYFSFCKYYNYTLEPETQRPLLSVLKDGHILYTLNMLIPKRHPLFNIINDAIAHIHQYGHFHKIYKDVTQAAYKGMKPKPDYVPLNISLLYLPFGALILGLVISFTAFIYRKM